MNIMRRDNMLMSTTLAGVSLVSGAVFAHAGNPDQGFVVALAGLGTSMFMAWIHRRRVNPERAGAVVAPDKPRTIGQFAKTGPVVIDEMARDAAVAAARPMMIRMKYGDRVVEIGVKSFARLLYRCYPSEKLSRDNWYGSAMEYTLVTAWARGKGLLVSETNSKGSGQKWVKNMPDIVAVLATDFNTTPALLYRALKENRPPTK